MVVFLEYYKEKGLKEIAILYIKKKTKMKNDYEATLNCFADFPDVEQDITEWTTIFLSGFIPIKIQK